jgi:FG-GAP-like repeat
MTTFVQRGVVEASYDQDWFAVTLSAGQSYRINSSFLSMSIFVRDASGAIVQTIGADGLEDVAGSSVTHFTAAYSGTYYISTLGPALAPNATLNYFVSVTSVTDDHGTTAATAGALTIGSTLAGSWEHVGDVDWYGATLTAGQSYVFSAANTADTIVGLYNASGTLLDYDAFGSLTIAPSTTGTYYFAVRDTTTAAAMAPVAYAVNVSTYTDDFLGNSGTTGTAIVGTARAGTWEVYGDDDWFAINLTANQSYSLTLSAPGTSGELSIRTPSGTTSSLATTFGAAPFTATTTGTYYARAASTGAPGAYSFVVAAIADDRPDNSSTTGTIAVGGTASGTWEVAGDRDWFAVTLTANQTYKYGVLGGIFANLSIRAADGSIISETGPGFEQVAFTPNTSGTYYLSAGFFGPTTGTYTVALSAIGDDFRSNATTTGSIIVGGTASGVIENRQDKDWFAVTLTAGQSYTFGVQSPSPNGVDGSDVNIVSASGQILTTHYGFSVPGHFTAPTTGTYYIEYDGRFVDTRSGPVAYQLSINTVADDFASNTATTGQLQTAVTLGTPGDDYIFGNLGLNRYFGGVGDDRFFSNGTPISGFPPVNRNAHGSVVVVGSDSLSVLRGIEHVSYGINNVDLTGYARGDLNADGTSDIVFYSQSSGTISLQSVINGVASGAATVGLPGSGNWDTQALGDFDRNGTSDLVLKNTSTGQFYLWTTANGVQTGGNTLGFVGTDWNVATTGDFNYDGTADVVWRNSTNGHVYIWTLVQSAGGIVQSGGVSLGILGTNWAVGQTGDFDGDGDSDVLLRDANTGQVYIYRMGFAPVPGGGFGLSVTGSASVGVFGADWTVAGVGDFNNDAVSDIALKNTMTGQFYLLLMNPGAAGFTGSNLGIIGTDWNIAAVGDYNKDGTDDILWRNTTTGQVYEWAMADGHQAASGSGNIGTLTADQIIV